MEKAEYRPVLLPKGMSTEEARYSRRYESV